MPKGHEIRFVGGKYIGKTDWIDNANKETSKMYYVYVDLGNETTKRTRVNKNSDRKPVETPSSCGEAVLLQCPDIEVKLDKLCLELAKCSIVIDTIAMIVIIQNRLINAISKQNTMGNKATYRHITFTNPAPPVSEDEEFNDQ
jgi:hypothetical protein